MREIKFRMWDKKANKYFYDPEIFICLMHQFSHDNNIRFHIAYDHVGDGSIFEQFTGLLDKNGVEIYEGDIVKCNMSIENGTLPHRGEIVYHNSFGAFATKNMVGRTLCHNHLLNTFKVIGNIHENPELLEKK